MGSRRTNKVVLMIDKVKAWCRMCTIMRDCGEEEKVQNCKEGNKYGNKERRKEIKSSNSSQRSNEIKSSNSNQIRKEIKSSN